MPRVLITGCGRSGTRYISDVLCHIGLDMPHEIRMGGDGKVSWYEAPARPFDRFGVVLHQVREPVVVIQSMTTAIPESWAFIDRVLRKRFQLPLPGRLETRDELVVAGTLYWVYWNRIASGCSSFFYRIEDIGKVLPRILEVFGCNASDDAIQKAFAAVPIDRNTRRPKYEVTKEIVRDAVDAVLWTELQRGARFYGYEL